MANNNLGDGGEFRVDTGVHRLIDESTAFKWPIVVAIVSVAFAVGGAWVKLTYHATAIDQHQTKLDDHSGRIQRTEDRADSMKSDLQDFRKEVRDSFDGINTKLDKRR